MNLTQFRFENDADGIALVTWDVPGKSMNLIDADDDERTRSDRRHDAADAEVKGVVIASGKDSFSGGADLTMLEASGRAYARRAKTRGRRKRRCRAFSSDTPTCRASTARSKPAESRGPRRSTARASAAASNWRWPAITASWPTTTRPASACRKSRSACFPAAAARTASPRLMPTPDALQMLLKGDQIKPAAAKAKNLVHARAAGEIVQKAKDWIKAGGKGVAPWDVKGCKAPSGKVFSPGGMMIWPPANAIYRRETYDNYPAARAILQCVYEACNCRWTSPCASKAAGSPRSCARRKPRR